MVRRKQQPREIRRGDGYVEERERAGGRIVHVARWHDGTRWRGKVFDAPEAAEDHLREIGRSKRRGDYTPDSPMTVKDWMEDYLARGQHRWSSNTVATYGLISKQYIVPHLGRSRLATLTAPRVQKWLDTLTSKKLSAAIVGNARSLLSGACDEAMQLGLIRTNPVTGTRAPARPRTPKLTWTAEQVGTILATIEAEKSVSTRCRWRAFYVLALTTGLRPGEIRAIRWQDVDLDNGIVTVRRTMTRDAGFHHKIGDITKTGRARAVAIPAETADALRAVRADQRTRRIAAEHWADHDLVFDRGDGNPLAQQTVSSHHHRLCQRAGVPRIRMHDLRHSAATLMLGNGIHPKIVADMLGHRSVTTTLDIYSHVDTSMQRAASESLAETILRKKKPV